MTRQSHPITYEQPRPRTIYFSEHPADCNCSHCPPAPSVTRPTHPILTVGGLLFGGIVSGQLIVVAIDWLQGGPGAFVVFGL